MNKQIKRRTALIGVGIVILAGVGLGSAVAPSSANQQQGKSAPTKVAERKGVEFKTNQKGQTYGSITVVGQQEVEPDLISALATNGKLGYVNNTELKAASGHPSQFKSPADAIKWQNANGKRAVSIPVYEEDGVTKVGQFVLKPSPDEEPK